MEPLLLQFNEITWSVSALGEQAVLLQGPAHIEIEQIHQAADLIERTLGESLFDMVPAYNSIALFTNTPIETIRTQLKNASESCASTPMEPMQAVLPICYEKGMDLEEMAEKLQLGKEELISIHLEGTYRSLFIGFTPGFVYADGLDKRLAYPRKKTPRALVPSGSVGIGGAQTGIYSLASPGGWNIIGRTPLSLFNPERQPPLNIHIGATFSFQRITESEFESWES